MRHVAAAAFAAAVCGLTGAPDAGAYRVDRSVVPQPELRYHVAPADWRRPFARVVRAVNRARVGVKLVRAEIPENASIYVGRLEHRCGSGGVEGTTQTLQGGFAAVYLPHGCRGATASIVAAHELGHALGLLHDDRRCALMNSSGTGRKLIPTKCLGRRINWLRHPYRADDLAGLRRIFRNTPPTAHLELSEPGRQVTAGDLVGFTIGAEDRENNLSELTIDFGDGDRATGFTAAELPEAHSYPDPGTYTVTLTVLDLFLRRDSASVTVTVAP
jgi:hypothetical protein